MKTRSAKTSWFAFGLFYLVLLTIVSILDALNQVLTLPYWGTQIGLITLGVAVFALIGIHLPDLSAGRGVLLAFTVGILTIIPAVLMGLGNIPHLWPRYFSIAFGMAAGSFLTFLFLKFSKRLSPQDQSDLEITDLD
jgi:hypothetical protein